MLEGAEISRDDDVQLSFPHIRLLVTIPTISITVKSSKIEILQRLHSETHSALIVKHFSRRGSTCDGHLIGDAPFAPPGRVFSGLRLP